MKLKLMILDCARIAGRANVAILSYYKFWTYTPFWLICNRKRLIFRMIEFRHATLRDWRDLSPDTTYDKWNISHDKTRKYPARRSRNQSRHRRDKMKNIQCKMKNKKNIPFIVAYCGFLWLKISWILFFSLKRRKYLLPQKYTKIHNKRTIRQVFKTIDLCSRWY